MTICRQTMAIQVSAVNLLGNAQLSFKKAINLDGSKTKLLHSVSSEVLMSSLNYKTVASLVIYKIQTLAIHYLYKNIKNNSGYL